MSADSSVDLKCQRDLIDWHVESGSSCICVIGTTGEAATLSTDERLGIISNTVEHLNGRLPVMAGAGASSTVEAIRLSKLAQQAGADYTLQMTPSYNRPTQEGLYQHFKAISDEVDIPQVIYNVPVRTGVDLLPETVVRLAELPNIVGIKDATGSMERAAWLIRECPPGFGVFSGDDSTAVSLVLLGGLGNISVTANVAPAIMAALCTAALKGDAATATQLHQQLLPLNRALFVESSPIPLKWALARIGRCNNTLRLPLTPLSGQYHAVFERAMTSAGVLVESSRRGTGMSCNEPSASKLGSGSR